MAKSLLRLQARELRRQGVSVKQIAQQLGIAKSSASTWVRDIILTIEQMEQLQQSELKGKERGRLKGALLQKERRLRFIEESKRKGFEAISFLTEREFLIAGLSLYWAEGCRKKRDVEVCNSDPKMIKFLLDWFVHCFKIPLSEIKCTVGINEIHREREEIVKNYWSETTGIPLTQFSKTSFKKVKNKKVYENHNEHYGTLSVNVLRDSRFYYRILGLIEGLHMVESNQFIVSQGSSGG